MVPAPKRLAAPATVVTAESASDATISRAKLPAALARKRLDREKRQGEMVKLSGEISTSGTAWGKLSPYRLVSRDEEGRAVTVCYLLGNSKQLALILGRQVELEGVQYWVRRVRYPGVRPDRIRVRRR